MTLATGLALATAQLAGGRYIDEQIGMLSGRHKPGQVISRTRLPEGGDDFALQCEKYLRQFFPPQWLARGAVNTLMHSNNYPRPGSLEFGDGCFFPTPHLGSSAYVVRCRMP